MTTIPFIWKQLEIDFSLMYKVSNLYNGLLEANKSMRAIGRGSIYIESPKNDCRNK